MCPVPVLEKKFKGQKTLGDADILTVHESGPIGFSEVTAHKKDTDNLGRVQSNHHSYNKHCLRREDWTNCICLL